MATTFWRENGRKGEEVSSEECQKLRRFSIPCSLFLSLSASYFLFTPNFKLISRECQGANAIYVWRKTQYKTYIKNGGVIYFVKVIC